MKKLTLAMILAGALTPALQAAPAQAGYYVPVSAANCYCYYRPYKKISVLYKKVVTRTVTLKPVVVLKPVIHTHISFKPVYYRHFFHRFYNPCYCAVPAYDYSDINVVYTLTNP